MRHLSTVIKCILRLFACFFVYVVTVVIGVYGVFGYFNGFYLLHLGNGSTAVFMIKDHRWVMRAGYTIVSFSAYFMVRYFNSTLIHIGIAGSANVIEQFCLYFLVDYLMKQKKVASVQFTLLLLAICSLVSITFASIGGLALAASTRLQEYHTIVILYFFSHLAGNYLSLQSVLILLSSRTYAITRRHSMYIVLFCIIAILLNALPTYGIFKDAVIVITFPFLALVATKVPIPAVVYVNILYVIILYSTLYNHRGPYVDPNKMTAIISSYFVIIINLSMSIIVSINVTDRNNDIENITRIKDDILFVSNQVSHDVRTPLTHITSICETIETNGQQTLVDELRFACDSITDIMNSWILVLKNKQSSDEYNDIVILNDFFYKIDLYVARSITISDKPELKFKLYGLEMLPHQILFHVGILYHVLTNLLSNAVKYSTSGEIGMHVQLIQETLVVKVQDRGIGIAESDLNRIFERFVTLNANRANSNGIGLHIVQTLLQKCTGTISVESVLNQGTTFTVQFPVRIITLEDHEAAIQLENLRLLLVEDNATTIRMVSRMLDPWQVTALDNGLLVEPHIQRTNFDAMLLDGRLPGLNGQQILEYIISEGDRYDRMGIVFIGGDDINVDIPRMVYCRKPFNRRALLTAIITAINNVDINGTMDTERIPEQ